MADENKLRLMTQLAIYEQDEGREDIRLGRYYQGDYVRLNVLKTAITFTISFAFLLGLIVVYNLEYLMDNALKLDYRSMALTVLGVYIAGLVIYVVCAAWGYSMYYRRSRRKLARYYRLLKKMRRIAEDGQASGYGDKENGEE